MVAAFENAISVISSSAWLMVESVTEKVWPDWLDMLGNYILMLICKCSIKVFNIQLNSWGKRENKLGHLYMY